MGYILIPCGLDVAHGLSTGQAHVREWKAEEVCLVLGMADAEVHESPSLYFCLRVVSKQAPFFSDL